MTLAVLRNIAFFSCALVTIAQATNNQAILCGVGMAKVGVHDADSRLPEYPLTRSLELGDRVWLDKLFAGCQPDCSQYNFLALWGWHGHDHYQLTRVGNATLIMMNGPNGPVFLQPLGVPAREAAETIAHLLRHFSTPLSFSHVGASVAQELKAIPDSPLHVTEQRDLAEYVYRATDLRDLQSHKDLRYKKKQVDEFHSLNANAEYVKLEDHPELLEKVEAALERWRPAGGEAPVDPKVAAEMEASRTAIRHFKEFGLKGGAYLIGGEVAAFSIGQKVNDGMFAIYVEKADAARFKGSYAAINQRFAKDIADAGFSFINRMDDWGVPGLRRAKQSYQPVFMVDNFRVAREVAAETAGN